MENRDFFISYTIKDEKWATWIRVLKTIIIHAYRLGFQPGGDFVLMHNIDPLRPFICRPVC